MQDFCTAQIIKVRLDNGEELKARASRAKEAGTVTAAQDLADLAIEAANL